MSSSEGPLGNKVMSIRRSLGTWIRNRKEVLMPKWLRGVARLIMKGDQKVKYSGTHHNHCITLLLGFKPQSLLIKELYPYKNVIGHFAIYIVSYTFLGSVCKLSCIQNCEIMLCLNINCFLLLFCRQILFL